MAAFSDPEVMSALQEGMVVIGIMFPATNVFIIFCCSAAAFHIFCYY